MNSTAKKRHERMVSDARRTLPLLYAVKKAVRPGDVVVDIGTGTGILAIAAAKAGAKMVWAVDCDADALEEAARAAERENVRERITFIEALSFDIDIPEKADVVICETVGSFAFDENILATIADAKRRFLKRGGKIIPERLELWAALCKILPKTEKPAEIARVNPNWLLTRPEKLLRVDFLEKIPNHVHVKHAFKAVKNGVVKCVAVWPRIVWFENEVTDASPFEIPTHWLCGIMQIEERKTVHGRKEKFEFIICPHPEETLTMTERLWRWID